MSDTTTTAAEVRAFTAKLRDISGRMAAGEDIPQDELDAYEADRDELLSRIIEEQDASEDTSRTVEDVILDLSRDQKRAVATVLGIVAGQVDQARDAAVGDRSARWSGLADAAHIVGQAAAYAQGVAEGVAGQ